MKVFGPAFAEKMGFDLEMTSDPERLHYCMRTGGAAVVLVLCWAVIRFAPAENVGLLSLHCLQQSHLGQLLVPLFLGPTL